MLNFIVALFKFLTPPRNATIEQLEVWRSCIAAGYLLILLLGALHVAWACNFIPGMPGFAMATEVDKVENKFDSNFEKLQTQFRKQELRLLEQAILEMRIRQCRIVVTSTTRDENNIELKKFVAEKMASLSYDYKTISGHEYSIPPCGDL